LSRARLATRAVVLAALALAVASPASAEQAPEAQQGYIVVLHDWVSQASAVASEYAKRYGAQVTYVYEDALKGFAISLPPSIATTLTSDLRVSYVEPDGIVTADVTQSPATWGIDRIDQRNRPLSNSYTYFRTGAGVRAYIIDTGLRFTHNQFGGRAINGFDAIDGGQATDCHGHGTHVGGTVGGSIHGVAKGVTLVAVRVLNCSGSGSTSGVIAGVNWVTGNHAAGQPAVANMSLGGGASTSLDNAVQNSINDGVSYAVAAGNGDIFGNPVNACTRSPARVGAAMTISATNSSDVRASWANIGSCVDWFAPGVSITSAWHTSNTATRTISGTSMATPHTAGVAALHLHANPGASPASVRSALFNLTTKDIVVDARSTNDHLLFTNY
jgi:subtilisin family serine protease